MGEFVDRLKGATNEAIGKAKISLGQSTDRPKLVIKGYAQEAQGKVQSKIGTLKGKLGNKP
jgi:uncharacterized protein YjbJ (UPF0337 family)